MCSKWEKLAKGSIWDCPVPSPQPFGPSQTHEVSSKKPTRVASASGGSFQCLTPSSHFEVRPLAWCPSVEWLTLCFSAIWWMLAFLPLFLSSCTSRRAFSSLSLFSSFSVMWSTFLSDLADFLGGVSAELKIWEARTHLWACFNLSFTTTIYYYFFVQPWGFIAPPCSLAKLGIGLFLIGWQPRPILTCRTSQTWADKKVQM